MKTSLPARDSVLIRYLLVVFITLCLMIPLLFVGELVDERQGLQRQVVQGIASSWGQSQTFIGPILVVPVTQQRTVVKDIEQQDGTRTQQRIQETSHHMLTILPDMLRHSMQIKPEERRRSIYRYTVYSSQVDIETAFTLPDVARELPKGAQLHLDQAYLSFGISDPTGLKGIQAVMQADFLPKAVTLSAEPGTRVRQFNTGFSMPLDRELGALQSERQKFSVRLSLNVDGSGGVRVAPVGEQSLISMQSSWPHPNFTGVKLPLEREISAQGFTARWDIPHLARSYPQRFLETAQKTEERSSRQNESAISGFTVGVDLFEPVTYYTLIDRAIKYAVLFIAMTFVALLAFEAIIRKRLHPVQYGLVGLAMIAFYLTLLSLAEHVLFAQAYVAASLVTINMISLYVYVALKSKAQALGMLVLLVALYSLLYALLQMEDYALLVGTGLVLAMLAVLMYVTRNLGMAGQEEQLAADVPAGKEA